MTVDADPFKVALFHLQYHFIQRFINMNQNAEVLMFVSDEELNSMELMEAFAGLPTDIMRQFIPRGFLDAFADASGDFELTTQPVADSLVHESSVLLLSWLSKNPEIFVLCFQTYFPFWHGLPPRRKQAILMLECPYSLWGLPDIGFGTWTADAFRLVLCPDGLVGSIDVQAWIDDGASILLQVLFCYLRSPYNSGAGDWEILLEDVIKATDDMHHRLDLESPWLEYNGTRSALEWALVEVLASLFSWMTQDWGKRLFHRALKKTIANLQTLMSILASCGHDLLEFGRQEADIWVSRDDAQRTVGDTLYLGIGGTRDGMPFVRALHYGVEPKDWYFELGTNYEDYAGDFWNLLENPHLFNMPGAWID